MSDDEEIKDIVKQFRLLQLQQTALVSRLDQLQDTATRAPRPARAAATPPTTQWFAVGDKVSILNPNRMQFSKGKIINIGFNRITVHGPNNKTLWRAPWNLAIIEDE